MVATKKNKRKLIVFLNGGTGNQLFQLLACENISQIHNREPFYSDHLLGEQRYLETADVASKLSIKKISHSQLIGIKLIEEESLCYPPLFNKFPEYELLPDEDLILSGYFQNYRIHSKSAIKKLRKFFLNLKTSSYLKEYTISLHLRELHGSLGSIPLNNIDNLNLEYYKRSLDLIDEDIKLNKKIGFKKAILFTDMFKDKSKSYLYKPVRQLLESKGYKVILGDNLCKNTLEVISLMSRANFVICSNSTFSWWGAYMSNGKKICPIFSLWEVNLTTPDNWIQIHDGNKNPKTWHKLNIYKNTIKTKTYISKLGFLYKLKLVLKQKIYGNLLWRLLDKYNALKIKSIIS